MSPFALRKNALSRSERRPTTELDLARPKVRHLPLRHTHPKCKRGDVWRSSLTLRVSVSLDRARYILGQVFRPRVLDRGQKPVALRQAARQEHLTCPPNLGSPPFLLKMVSRERHGASVGRLRLHRRLAPCRSLKHPTQMAESPNLTGSLESENSSPSDFVRQTSDDGAGGASRDEDRSHTHWNVTLESQSVLSGSEPMD